MPVKRSSVSRSQEVLDATPVGRECCSFVHWRALSASRVKPAELLGGTERFLLQAGLILFYFSPVEITLPYPSSI